MMRVLIMACFKLFRVSCSKRFIINGRCQRCELGAWAHAATAGPRADTRNIAEEGYTGTPGGNHGFHVRN